MFKKKYRVVGDSYLGYECQYKVWWWPFWLQIGGCNTWSSLEEAKAYVERMATVHATYTED